MLTILISVLVLALVLFVIWYAISLFGVPGNVQKVIGLILALILLVYALDRFGYHL